MTVGKRGRGGECDCEEEREWCDCGELREGGWVGVTGEERGVTHCN